MFFCVWWLLTYCNCEKFVPAIYSLTYQRLRTSYYAVPLNKYYTPWPENIALYLFLISFLHSVLYFILSFLSVTVTDDFFLINTVCNKSEFGSHNQSVNGQHIFTRAKGFNRLPGLRNRNVKVIEHSYCINIKAKMNVQSKLMHL
jgi:hypothetical protein